jgi:cyanophycinase
LTGRIKGMGTLIPIGGNEDKGTDGDENYTLDFIDEGILSHVVRESGGVEALIVVIPTASSIPVVVAKNYQSAFQKLGCSNVKTANIQSPEDAKSSDYLQLISKADCVLFSGGNQSKISSNIGGSKFHSILVHRYKTDNLVIAGTSAGAMSMAIEMIAGGSSTEAFFKGTVKMRTGLGLLPELIFDTHFIQRGRFGRMTEAVAKYPDKLGVGLAEDTGLIIREGRYCTVIGSGMVIIFDPSRITHNNEEILDEGVPMTVVGLQVHVLSNGDTIDIETRKVEALPLDVPFNNGRSTTINN